MFIGEKWSLHLLVRTHRQNDIVAVPDLSKPVIAKLSELIPWWRIKEKVQSDSNSFKELTPPSFKILDMISIYSTILCAVSIKKQVTTASQTPACNTSTLHKNSLQRNNVAGIMCLWSQLLSPATCSLAQLEKEKKKPNLELIGSTKWVDLRPDQNLFWLCFAFF